MFENKKSSLFEVPSTSKGKEATVGQSNPFIAAGMKQSARTLSGNMAEKFKTTGNPFLDQFSNLSLYKSPRKFEDISNSMSELWAIDSVKTIKLTIYMRIITRKTQLIDGSSTTEVQRGAGLKHEAIMRMLWLNMYHEEEFMNALPLFIAAGSWKDVFVMMKTDLIFNGWGDKTLDWDFMGDVILAGLENPKTSELVKKYLPHIKAKSKCKTVDAQANTIIGKYLSGKLFDDDKKKSYALYRKLKSGGTAHTWQQLISQGKFKEIDFSSIHGRALMLLVSGEFINNQGLTQSYESWILSQPVAKFTGYPFELFEKMPDKLYREYTVNKQFEGLVQIAKTGANPATSMIAVVDTSASMNSAAIGTNIPSATIAKSMALFFSYMLPDGAFANSWMDFNNVAEMHMWKGSTPVEKFKNAKGSGYMSGTNFISIFDLFARIKRSGVPESEFPTGVICISDGEFNRQGTMTNFEMAFRKLLEAGFSENFIDNFKMVLWDIPNGYYNNPGIKFETYGEHNNTFYMSGYDPAPIAFLTGLASKQEQALPKTAEELLEAALSQELLDLVG